MSSPLAPRAVRPGARIGRHCFRLTSTCFEEPEDGTATDRHALKAIVEVLIDSAAATDADQARMEVAFFLKAWFADHPGSGLRAVR
jgi:hypothetical protein